MASLAHLGTLLLGGALQILGFGRWMVAPAAWLAPVFLLHYAREAPLGGLVVLWLVLVLAAGASNRGVIPLKGLGYGGVVAGIAAAMTVPFLMDRLFAAQPGGVWSTLVFPVTWTAVGFLTARFNPFGTWGMLAYTQHGIGPLMQLASVTGIWGIDFLITWFAAVANWAWDLHFDWSLIQNGVAFYGAVLGLVLVGGGLRLALAPHRATVRVAGLAWPEGGPESGEYERVLSAVFRQAIDDQVQESMARLQEVFFERTLREARAGAQIILWSEASVLVLKEEEEALIERARSLARANNVYLLMGLAVLSPGANRPLENKAVFVSSAGEVMASYNKTMAVPGLERQLMTPGTGRIPVVETPYGRVASPICFDLDFPHLVRQVGVAGADLLLVLAADWAAITHLHQAMAEFRAVENGTAMVRVTRSGGSGAVDPYGRRCAFLDSYTTEDAVLVANVPVRAGRGTMYSSAGDLFAWLCVFGVAVLVVRAVAGILG